MHYIPTSYVHNSTQENLFSGFGLNERRLLQRTALSSLEPFLELGRINVLCRKKENPNYLVADKFQRLLVPTFFFLHLMTFFKIYLKYCFELFFLFKMPLAQLWVISPTPNLLETFPIDSAWFRSTLIESA